jgi:oxalate decarboxylase/phosphoglucose isomerase-like protein (cupin superfamily)
MRRLIIASIMIVPALAAYAGESGSFEIQQPKGTWQQPGEIQVPTGPWQEPGDIQVPKGIQALHTTKEQCEERLSVVADALFDFDSANLRSDAEDTLVAAGPEIEKLAGVYMTLEPGGLRELHWHANAAEWAYVIEGRCRVTTIDPQNQCEIVECGPGDVWYFPRGHGHSIQRPGPGTCTFVLVFDNGYFSEFGTFSITDWLGHTPPDVLAKPSMCRPRLSPTSRRKRSISQPGRCRRPLPSSRRRVRWTSRR